MDRNHPPTRNPDQPYQQPFQPGTSRAGLQNHHHHHHHHHHRQQQQQQQQMQYHQEQQRIRQQLLQQQQAQHNQMRSAVQHLSQPNVQQITHEELRPSMREEAVQLRQIQQMGNLKQNELFLLQQKEVQQQTKHQYQPQRQEVRKTNAQYDPRVQYPKGHVVRTDAKPTQYQQYQHIHNPQLQRQPPTAQTSLPRDHRGGQDYGPVASSCMPRKSGTHFSRISQDSKLPSNHGQSSIAVTTQPGPMLVKSRASVSEVLDVRSLASTKALFAPKISLVSSAVGSRTPNPSRPSCQRPLSKTKIEPKTNLTHVTTVHTKGKEDEHGRPPATTSSMPPVAIKTKRFSGSGPPAVESRAATTAPPTIAPPTASADSKSQLAHIEQQKPSRGQKELDEDYEDENAEDEDDVEEELPDESDYEIDEEKRIPMRRSTRIQNVEPPPPVRSTRSNSKYLLRGSEEPKPNTSGMDMQALLEQTVMLDILKDFAEDARFDIFCNPVSEGDAPGYHEVIEHPMDFSTLRNLVKTGSVTLLGDFYENLQLIVDNCVVYNGKGTWLYDAAKDLQRTILRRLKKLSRDIAKADEFPSKLLQITRQLVRHKDSEPFRKPLTDESVLPAYSAIVKRPMDFTTLTLRIEERKYANLEEFAENVRLIRDNCIKFNGKTSPFSVMAMSIWRRFMELTRMNFPDVTMNQLESPRTSNGDKMEEEKVKEDKVKEDEVEESEHTEKDKGTIDSMEQKKENGEMEVSQLPNVSQKRKASLRKRVSKKQRFENREANDILNEQDALESHWKFGFLNMWCETFGRFVFPQDFVFDPRALQKALEQGGEYATQVGILLLRIYHLEGSNVVIDEFSWERELKDQIDNHLAECGLHTQDENPLASYAFAEIDALSRMKTLAWICEWCLAEVQTIRDLIVYDNGRAKYKSEAFGDDGIYTYWHFFQGDRAVAHVYREKPVDSESKKGKDNYEWKIVCTNYEEAKDFLKELNRTKPKTKTGRHNLGLFKACFSETIIQELERRKEINEMQERQSRKLGVNLNNIITEGRRRRAPSGRVSYEDDDSDSDSG